jgi:hypothetical protein
MNLASPHINLLAAWVGLLLGFASGLVLGLFFRRDDWLGGYASFRRRLYRLAHISFFGLGVVNLCFYFTARSLAIAGPGVMIASWAFVAGAITMPICCVVMAHFPRTHLLFGAPVLSLLLGGIITVILVAGAQPHSGASGVDNRQPRETTQSSISNLQNLSMRSDLQVEHSFISTNLRP